MLVLEKVNHSKTNAINAKLYFPCMAFVVVAVAVAYYLVWLVMQRPGATRARPHRFCSAGPLARTNYFYPQQCYSNTAPIPRFEELHCLSHMKRVQQRLKGTMARNWILLVHFTIAFTAGKPTAVAYYLIQ
eukprot:352429-Amphidinium_carterae.1